MNYEEAKTLKPGDVVEWNGGDDSQSFTLNQFLVDRTTLFVLTAERGVLILNLSQLVLRSPAGDDTPATIISEQAAIGRTVRQIYQWEGCVAIHFTDHTCVVYLAYGDEADLETISEIAQIYQTARAPLGLLGKTEFDKWCQRREEARQRLLAESAAQIETREREELRRLKAKYEA